MGQSCTRPAKKDIEAPQLLEAQKEGGRKRESLSLGNQRQQNLNLPLNESYQNLEVKTVLSKNLDLLRGHSSAGLESTRHPGTEAEYSANRSPRDSRDVENSLLSKYNKGNGKMEDLLTSRDDVNMGDLSKRSAEIDRDQRKGHPSLHSHFRPVDYESIAQLDQSRGLYLPQDLTKQSEMMAGLSLHDNFKGGQKSSYLLGAMDSQLGPSDSISLSKGKIIFATPEFAKVSSRNRAKSVHRISENHTVVNQEKRLSPHQMTLLEGKPGLSAKEMTHFEQKLSDGGGVDHNYGGSKVKGVFHGSPTQPKEEPRSNRDFKKVTAHFNFDLHGQSMIDAKDFQSGFQAHEYPPEQSGFRKLAQNSMGNLPPMSPDVSVAGYPNGLEGDVLPLSPQDLHSETFLPTNKDTTLRQLATIDETAERSPQEGSSSMVNPSLPSGIAVFSRENLPIMTKTQNTPKAVNNSSSLQRGSLVTNLALDLPFQHQSFSSLNDPLEELEQQKARKAIDPG